MSYYVSGIVLRLIRLLRRDTFEDGVRYHAVTALSDGAPVFIGYADIRVSSPDQRHTVTWTYAGEPPFGDSVNQVFFDGEALPGHYWGRGHIWSPFSDYFTLDRRTQSGGALYVVRTADAMWVKIAESASAISFVYPFLEYRHYDYLITLTKRFDLLDPLVWTTFKDS